MSVKFYDTSSMLLLGEEIFSDYFTISTVSLQELESIKTSSSKDSDTKYKARKLGHLLDENMGRYRVCQPQIELLASFNLQPTNDNLIAITAFMINKSNPIVFYSDDIYLKIIAREVLGISVSSAQSETSNTNQYKGYIEIPFSDFDLAYFYEHLNCNNLGILTNEYLVLKNINGETKDIRRWNGNTFLDICKKTIKTKDFGDKIKAKDEYQQMAIDSMLCNTITAISGKAGSGKSLLSLLVAMHLIEIGKYDRLVILFNPTKTKGASDCGFYSGSLIEKAMQNSIGQILTTKFGDRYAVDSMIQSGKLKLVSMADCRGMEIKDSEILFLTECQNTSKELLKLCLSRCSQNAKIIIEGDYTAQVDNYAFENENNGMRRAIDVLKGEDIFGYVELKNIYRSKIASLVEKM